MIIYNSIFNTGSCPKCGFGEIGIFGCGKNPACGSLISATELIDDG